jgi:hypothetical protein
MPTFVLNDCRVSCSLYTDMGVGVVQGHAIADIAISSDFEFSFDITVKGKTQDQLVYANLIDVINLYTGVRLFRIGISGSGNLKVFYKTATYVDKGPVLDYPGSSAGEYATVQLTLVGDVLSLWTSVAPQNHTMDVISGQEDTTGQVYRVYASGPALNALTDGEFVKNFNIKGNDPIVNPFPCLPADLVLLISYVNSGWCANRAPDHQSHCGSQRQPDSGPHCSAHPAEPGLPGELHVLRRPVIRDPPRGHGTVRAHPPQQF